MRRHSSVAVVDKRDFRRASLMSLLEPWASGERLGLTSYSPDQLQGSATQTSDLKMLIFSLGGELLSENSTLQRLAILRSHLPNLPFVVLSDREDVGDVALAMSSGVQGYIFTGIDSRFAFQALSFILHGGIYFPPSAIAGFHRENSGISGKISEDVDQEIKSSASEINDRGNGESQENGAESITLTHRQKEVLDHIRLGESNKVIARHLGMTEGTVKVHVRQIMRKAGVSNRTQLAVRNVVHASHDRN